MSTQYTSRSRIGVVRGSTDSSHQSASALKGSSCIEELSVESLQDHCATDELASVGHIELRLDSSFHCVDLLGSLLPNLVQLRLSGSNIGCIRELGSGLQNLQVLWLVRCGIQDIGGIGSMRCLRELYIAFNHIVDVSLIGDNEAIEVLDVEGNAIADISEVASLWVCSNLKDLTLRGNPVCRDASFSRDRVYKLLPQLQNLDDVEAACGFPGCDSKFDANEELSFPVAPMEAWRSDCQLPTPVPHEFQERDPLTTVDADEPDEEELIIERLRASSRVSILPAQRSATFTHNAHSFLPLGRHMPSDGVGGLDLSAGKRNQEHVSTLEDTASDLTCGGQLGGSPLSAVRQRRKRTTLSYSAAACLGIRALIEQNESFVDTRSGSEGDVGDFELRERRHRVQTPDVRIRQTASVGGDAEEVKGNRIGNVQPKRQQFPTKLAFDGSTRFKYKTSSQSAILRTEKCSASNSSLTCVNPPRVPKRFGEGRPARESESRRLFKVHSIGVMTSSSIRNAYEFQDIETECVDFRANTACAQASKTNSETIWPQMEFQLGDRYREPDDTTRAESCLEEAHAHFRTSSMVMAQDASLRAYEQAGSLQDMRLHYPKCATVCS